MTKILQSIPYPTYTTLELMQLWSTDYIELVDDLPIIN